MLQLQALFKFSLTPTSGQARPPCPLAMTHTMSTSVPLFGALSDQLEPYHCFGPGNSISLSPGTSLLVYPRLVRADEHNPGILVPEQVCSHSQNAQFISVLLSTYDREGAG